MPLTEEQIREIEAILERGCFGHDVDPRWAMPAATVCTCFEDFEERAVALIAALSYSQAEARRLRERIEQARQYLLGAIDREVIACACWGASGCDAHELIYDLDPALAATAPAPAREGTS